MLPSLERENPCCLCRHRIQFPSLPLIIVSGGDGGGIVTVMVMMMKKKKKKKMMMMVMVTTTTTTTMNWKIMICGPSSLVFLVRCTERQTRRRCFQSPGLLGDVNWLGVDTLPQSSRRANGVAERWGIQVLLLRPPTSASMGCDRNLRLSAADDNVIGCTGGHAGSDSFCPCRGKERPGAHRRRVGSPGPPSLSCLLAHKHRLLNA